MTKIKLPMWTLITRILFVLFVWVLSPYTTYAGGPTLLLSPTEQTIISGQTHTFTVTLNTADQNIFGADAVITYNPQALEVTSVTKGDFFTDFSKSVDAAGGIIEMHGYFSSLYDTHAGTGSLGTFAIKAKKNSGTTTVSLTCNTSANTSQIINNNGVNILPCSEVNLTTITLAGTTNTSPTPTPTGTYTNIAPQCNGLSVSPTSGNAPMTVSFTCSGSDTDNDVTAAEFDFGNGTKKLVEKNIGQFGSIVATYTYTAAGTFSASCRMRDNNQKFSDTPDICKRTVAIKTGAIQPPINTGTPASTGSTDPIVYTGTETVTLTPYTTPTPTVRITPTPIELPTEKKNDRLFQLGTILLISIVTIAAGLILRRMIGGPDS